MKSWSRKDFIKVSVFGGGAALLAGSSRLHGQGSPAIVRPGSPNSDIRLAIVGINGKGNSHLKSFLSMSGVKVVALCDADANVLSKRADEASKAGSTVKQYRDYRKLLEDPNIDAVLVATPNHWHSLMTIWAVQAGKDIYIEKPLSHNIWEGRQAVEATNQYKDRIVQAGTQNRSSLDIPEAIAFVRSGQIGKIQVARGLCYKLRESIGKTTGDQAIPANIDYNLWTGPAALVPSHRNNPKHGPVHYDWHWFWNYGGGDISNQGIHQMDVARWFLGEDSLPPSVMSFGGRFGPTDDAETPNTEVCIFNYKKVPLVFEVRGLPMKTGMQAMDAFRGTRVGVVIHCEGGYVSIAENGTVAIYDNDNKKIKQLQRGGLETHPKNFIQALRSRDRNSLNGKVENSHISTALCHMGNVSYLTGAEKSDTAVAEAVRSDSAGKEVHGRVVEHLRANGIDLTSTKVVLGPLLKFDAATERFVGGPDKAVVAKANSSILVKREGRGEFKIPQFKSQVVAHT